MAPIEKDLIIRESLNKNEKKWLNNYHKTVFKNLKKFMNKIEAFRTSKSLFSYLKFYSNPFLK